MAGEDPGRYLTSLEGVTHELFGGDPEEIVLRVARIGEGATTLTDLARELRTEAGRYERMAAAGWALAGPFSNGTARCRKDPGDATPGDVGAPGGGEATGSPARLAEVVDGAATLPAAAGRLREAAGHYEELDAEGHRLAGPVEGGHIPLS